MGTFSKLNRHEFIQYWRERESPEREQVKLKWLFLYLVGLLPFVILHHVYDFNTDKETGATVGLVVLCYMIVAPLVWMHIFARPVRVEFHRCPSCSKMLVQANRMVVAATSRCGCCAETILEDSALTPSPQS